MNFFINLFNNTRNRGLLSVDELDKKYVIITNVYTSPVLVTKNSPFLDWVNSANHNFDESVPDGTGRVYKFSEGMKTWGRKNWDFPVLPFLQTVKRKCLKRIRTVFLLMQRD